MIRSEIFHRLKGFDVDFFAHMEEIDLCWRINRSGYLIYYQGESEVLHLGGGTLPKSNPKKTYLNFRNSLFTLYKNESKEKLIWKIPLRLSMDYVAALRYLFYFNLKNFLSIFNAHFDFFKSLKNTRKKKQLLEIPVKQDIALPIYQKSIVWDYFLSGRKKFSQLIFKI
jgi:GT2 family glycosyltransferase